MRFNYYATVFAAMCGTALSLGKSKSNIDSVTHPTKGEIIQAGSTYEIEWEMSQSSKKGPVRIILQNKKSTDYTGYVELLSSKYTDGERFEWKVCPDLPPRDDYYIRIAYVNDVTDFKDSDLFKIGASNNTSTSSSTPSSIPRATSLPASIVTGSAAISPSPSASGFTSTSSSSSATASTSATSTPTPTGGGSVATSFVSAPLVMAGVVAVGMFAL